MIKFIQNYLFAFKYFFKQRSFAQEGEDLILRRFLGSKRNGFYIDIGAHHPFRFSNTFSFYQKGWTGINIDAMPGSMESFKKLRPKDINLEIGISSVADELTFYMFNSPALNTFSKLEAEKKNKIKDFKIINRRIVKTRPLSSILDAHLNENQKIDFMSVDVEGLDLDVVKSNDWKKYRPEFLLIEDLKKYDFVSIANESEVYKYLISHDYKLVAKTFNTLFFQDGEMKQNSV